MWLTAPGHLIAATASLTRGFAEGAYPRSLGPAHGSLVRDEFRYPLETFVALVSRRSSTCVGGFYAYVACSCSANLVWIDLCCPSGCIQGLHRTLWTLRTRSSIGMVRPGEGPVRARRVCAGLLPENGLHILVRSNAAGFLSEPPVNTRGAIYFCTRLRVDKPSFSAGRRSAS